MTRLVRWCISFGEKMRVQSQLITTTSRSLYRGPMTAEAFRRVKIDILSQNHAQLVWRDLSGRTHLALLKKGGCNLNWLLRQVEVWTEVQWLLIKRVRHLGELKSTEWGGITHRTDDASRFAREVKGAVIRDSLTINTMNRDPRTEKRV